MQKFQKMASRKFFLLPKLKHPHLVRIYETIIQEKCIHIVMAGGELFDIIENKGKMRENDARSFSNNLC